MPTKLNNKLRRLYLYFDKLSRYPATVEQILDMLNGHGIQIGIATFERDKKTIREDLGYEIVYNASDKTYKLEKPDEHLFIQTLQFLQNHELASVIKEGLSDYKSGLQFIDFENDQQLKGIEYLEGLFEATKQHYIIKIEHRKFETSHAKSYTLRPYLLKQYQSRWYVVGETDKHKTKLFGIDRIEKLEITNTTFKPKAIDLKQKFRQLIGVSGIYLKPEYVQLTFANSQYEYLEQLPLHHSQQLVELNENQVIYDYFVVLNFELEQQILKYGGLVKVLKPKSLADKIKKELKKAHSQYK